MSDFKNGDTVRVKSSGHIGTLQSINPREDFDPLEEIWAEVEFPDYDGTELDGPDDIEHAELAILPTKKEVMDSLDILGSNWSNDDWSLIETGWQTDDVMYVIGRTGDGQEFSFDLTISKPEAQIW